MGRHWNPNDDLARLRGGTEPQLRWPDGATAGLVMVASACLAIGLVLYKMAAPRDIFGG